MADQEALDVLDNKLLRVALQNISPTENVHFALKGNFGQALLALDDRILVLKAGWMAGATLGGKATSFPYDQISAIELKAGPVNAVLQIQSSAFQAGQAGSYWTSDKKHDPTKLPNCITAPSSTVKKWQPFLDRARARIARGAWPSGGGTSKPSPVGENVLIRRIDPAGEGAVFKIVGRATGLPTPKVAKIVHTHEVIECADATEATELKKHLEQAGATVELRASLDEDVEDEDVEDEPVSRGSVANELERLADLHRQGMLTDAEFAAAKSKVLET